MRVFLRVAYDGTNYHGWQFQEGLPTVEGVLSESLMALTGKESSLIGCSRTDAGVHAFGNTAVFDTDSSIPGDRFIFALNDILPNDIRIMESKEVSSDFHPRYLAKEKIYEYTIDNSPVQLPTKRLYSYNYRGSLDVDAMREAAYYLVGEHDFTSFASVHSQTKSFVRTIYSLDVETRGKDVIIRPRGNGFLYNMVRIIAGTLLETGTGRRSPKSVNEALLGKDRSLGGETLPPRGLCLVKIIY